MKELFIGLTLLTSVSAFAKTDIQITVQTENDLSVVATGTYLATKDSFFCKEFSMNDGSPTRIFKRRYKYFKSKNGVVSIPQSIDSKCNYKRVGGGSLAFEIPGKAEAYNVVSIFEGEGDLTEQVVNCSEIISGPSNNRRKMISCYGDIRTTNEGKASVITNKN